MARTTKKKSTSKKKRTLSAAQKAALARGRAKLKTKRKTTAKKSTRKAATGKTARKKTVAKKSPAKKKTTVKKTTATGGSMAKRKSSKKTSTVSRARRAAGSFVRSSDAVGMLKQSGLAIAGGIGAGMLANKVPIADKRIKSALPIVAGIVLSGTLGKRNKMVKGIAEGMVILGSVSLFKSLAPNVPFLAGDDPQYFIPSGIPYTPPEMIPDQSTVAGEMVNLGERVDMGIDEYYSPADI